MKYILFTFKNKHILNIGGFASDTWTFTDRQIHDHVTGTVCCISLWSTILTQSNVLLTCGF